MQLIQSVSLAGSALLFDAGWPGLSIIHWADSHTYGLASAQIVVDCNISSMNPQSLGWFHLIPNVMTAMLAIFLQFTGEIRIYRHV